MLPLVRTPVVPLRTCPRLAERAATRDCDRWCTRQPPHTYLHRVCKAGNTHPTHIKAEVSLVIEINQKNQSTHFPKAMHYIKAENHEKSVTSQSSFSSAMVRCPALSQIKPHNPLLVVLLPSILLNFIIANIHSTKTAVGFPHSASCVGVGV